MSTITSTNESGTNSGSIRSIAGMAVAAIGALTLVLGISGGTVLGEPGTVTIPLENQSAGIGTDCPDSVGDYWHFVIAPNNASYEFVSITLNLDGTGVTFADGEIIPNDEQLDNVFVAVPQDATLTSLVSTGSSAQVLPSTGTTSSTSPKFVLSHICSGSGYNTTTTSTTTTTTTLEPTTTTTASSSTSSTSTTTSVASGGPTTTADETTTTLSGSSGPTTTQGPTLELPKTGASDNGTLALIGAGLLLLGGIMLLGTRRPL